MNESGRQEHPSPLRATQFPLRSVHEVVVTRFEAVVAICGQVLRRPDRAPDLAEVTCIFCNGTEPRLNEGEHF